MTRRARWPSVSPPRTDERVSDVLHTCHGIRSYLADWFDSWKLQEPSRKFARQRRRYQFQAGRFGKISTSPLSGKCPLWRSSNAGLGLLEGEIRRADTLGDLYPWWRLHDRK